MDETTIVARETETDVYTGRAGGFKHGFSGINRFGGDIHFDDPRPVIQPKNWQRRRLQRHVDEFVAAGGTVTEYPAGQSALDLRDLSHTVRVSFREQLGKA